MDIVKIEYTKEQKELIEATLLKGCTDFEKMQVYHLAEKYGLDLLQKGQLWVTGFGNQKNIIVGRDGQLTIAHRQGLKSLKTTCEYQPEDIEHRHPVAATCVVERFDGGHFEATAVFADYNTNKALWATKPSEMIGKVAESKVLRRAFDMSGFYSSEELEDVKVEARAERDNAIEKAEKEYDGALFKSRKEREAEAREKPVEKKVETPKEGPAPTTNMEFIPYDLSRPYMAALDFADLCTEIEANYMCKVTKEERDACRRSDGKYDLQAATVLQQSKFKIFSESKTGVKA